MLEIRKMTLDDLELVLKWAAGEGWNPGLEDAEAFLRTDPSGFLLGSIDAVPACAISVIKYNEQHAFLGLYLCQPEFRGQGHGWAIWNAGINSLEKHVVGLDGVVAQQDNYRKSGFTLSHRNIRFTGGIDPSAVADECVEINSELRPAYLALDKCAGGFERRAYLASWLAPANTRISAGYIKDGMLVGAGTIRQCGQGHKIGPLVAPDQSTAEKIIYALCQRANAREICIDVPEPNVAAMALVNNLQLAPVFETARMYRGTAPSANIESLYGVTTLELG